MLVLAQEPQTPQALHGQDEPMLVRTRPLRRGRQFREYDPKRMQQRHERPSASRHHDLDHAASERLHVHTSSGLRQVVG